MTDSRRSRRAAFAALAGLSVALGCALPHAFALQSPQETKRFDRLVIADPAERAGAAAVRLEAIAHRAFAGAKAADETAPGESLQTAWGAFRATAGPGWELVLDSRSGAPLLAQGEGIPWIAGSANSLAAAAPVSLDSLAVSLRSFVASRPSLFFAKDTELVLSREGSGQITPDLWQVAFDRVVSGVPVAGDRYLFYIGHGNLISFGATRWTPIAPLAMDTMPSIGAVEAMGRLFTYMGLTPFDHADILDEGSLQITPMTAEAVASNDWSGAIGDGYRAALTWKLALTVDGEGGTWVGLVDAHSGQVLALYDDNKYAFVKGGVFPLSPDGICPSGCEQLNFPMPFADVKINGTPATVSAMGTFACSPVGGTATTTLQGTFVKVVDTCGAISESISCDNDLDLKTSSGTNCTVPAGSSAGNTHAARSSFYHLNRIREHARAWLPSTGWLTTQLTDNVNINLTCNAFWGGSSVNFYRSGGGCRNTGEIAGIFLHEWGHGLDQNDGGGFDNPTEAYADITSMLLTHSSCIGRGFTSGNCGGYGNSCLACTGVRDQDWNQRASHLPSTPEGFIASCPGGSGPCGKENHCESYLPGEALWDLAARDLPASGIDANTSWLITDRLWYKSRTGSGGSAYSCGSPASTRSCAASSWMQKLRVVDDDDGNLANGTPHAAAIFAAFNRHNIPCGAAGDASNQSTTVCPAIATPAAVVTGSPSAASVSWPAVPGATSYNVFRNDQGCGWGFTLLANVPGTSYNDTGLINGLPVYYSVQAVGASSSCLSALSTCQSAIPGGPHAIYQSNAPSGDDCSFGGIGDGDGVPDPGEQVQFSVTFKNDGNGTLTGVTATVTTSTPGVTMVDGTASFPNIPAGAAMTSLAPHFTSQLASNMACGATITYQVTLAANEGSWSGSFTQRVGLINVPSGTVLSENFSGGIPGTWTVVDGGLGGGTAATWTTANPGSRTFAAPIANPAPIVDSAFAGAGASQDEESVSPALNLSTAVNVTLDFDQNFTWFSGGLDEIGDVDVKSSRTGGAWINVFRNQGASSTNPNHRTLSITSQAGGATGVQVRFRYYQGNLENWWQVDNVAVSYTGQATCSMHTCVAPASADLALVQNDSPDPVAAGGTLTYATTVSNSGPNPATSVQLSTSTPANTTFLSLSKPAAWNCSTPSVGGTGPISCTVSSLASGANAAFSLALKVGYCVGNGTVVSGSASVTSSTSDPSLANNASGPTSVVTDNGACDDGNTCTTGDVCSGASCAGTPAAPSEVNNTLAVTKSGTDASIAWTDAPGGFNVYRGLEGPLAAWSYNQSCFAPAAASPVADAQLPSVGRTFYYLVSRETVCGESVLGRSSGGAPIPNGSSCP